MNKKIKKIIAFSTTFVLASMTTAITVACTNDEPKPSVREIDKNKLTNKSQTGSTNLSENKAKEETKKEDNSNPQNEKETQNNSLNTEKPNEGSQNQEDQAKELFVSSIEYTKISENNVEAKITLNRELEVSEQNNLSVKLTESVSGANTDTFNAYKDPNDSNALFMHVNFSMLEPNKEYTILDFVFNDNVIKKPTTNLTFRTLELKKSNSTNTDVNDVPPENNNESEINPPTTETNSSDETQPNNEHETIDKKPSTESQTDPNQDLSVVSIEYVETAQEDVQARITFSKNLSEADVHSLKVKLTEIVPDAETDTFPFYIKVADKNTPIAYVDFYFLESNKEYTIADFIYKDKIITKPTTNLTFRTSNPEDNNTDQ